MIFTFYSFKGGVGRSMALANVAEILYRRGLRVVIVDWDLEAPGLEKYFFTESDDVAMIQSQPGLIDLLLRYKRTYHKLDIDESGETAQIVAQLKAQLDPIQPLLRPIHAPEAGQGALYLISAGLQYGDHFSTYAQTVQGFDWAEFYSMYQGEAFFEWLRSQLLDKDVADIVLIDSRTGVTEMGGVCTRQLADCVVMLVAPNEQNLLGTVMMARSLTRSELKETRGGKPLPLIFVPSRIEDSEGELLSQFAKRFRDELVPFASPSLVKDIFLDLKIRYVPYFAYMESLAVNDARNPVAADLVTAYERLAETLSKVAPPGHALRRSYRPQQASGIVASEILVTAGQESHRMQHYYLGVEHLFVAMAQIRGGVVSRVLERQGMTAHYVIEAIRRKFGKGVLRQRQWAGMPNSPRLEKILEMASTLAQESERDAAEEKDLFLALLMERRNLVASVLKNLGLDLDRLIEMTQQTTVQEDQSAWTFLRIDYAETYQGNQLSKDQAVMLRRVFFGYARIRIQRRLSDEAESSTLVLVVPIMADDRVDAPVVVKISEVAEVLGESQRYERYVRNTLPPLTARVEGKPTTSETTEIAAVKYSLIATDDQMPRTLSDLLANWSGEQIASWLYDVLYKTYTRWWQQGRPFRFQVWREYDWMLPPVLTLETLAPEQAQGNPLRIRLPVNVRKLDGLEVGSPVIVENFTIFRINAERREVRLAAALDIPGAAFQIDLRNVDLLRSSYFRGEIVESIAGQVWRTRRDEIADAIRALDPDFDPTRQTLRVNPLEFPNPLYAYEALLELQVTGMMCTIHGNFTPTNILVGPGDIAVLTDFAYTRDGHAVSDWATLELHLIAHASKACATWEDQRGLTLDVWRFYQGEDPSAQSLLAGVHEPLRTVRKIAGELLANPDDWGEYYIVLALTALRNMIRRHLPLHERRIMLLICAAALEYLRTKQREIRDSATASPDETDNNLE